MTTHTRTNPAQASLSLSMAVKKQAPRQVKLSQNSKKKRATQAITPIPRQCRKEIETFFYTLSTLNQKLEQYRKEWEKEIKPQSDLGRLNRWRFAFCTVHTPWLPSCEQYLDIKDNFDDIQLESLLEKLAFGSGGMHNSKAEGILNLQHLWNATPELFELSDLSSRDQWRKARNRLTKKLNYLGLAKTSFALEMLEPLKCQVICIDRHMFRAFGWTDPDKAASQKQYEYYEDYWLDLCNYYKVEPAIARNLYWDIIQQQPSSMYWGEYLKDYDYIIHSSRN